MNSSNKINIYVGTVGSAYVDKETARKHVLAAEKNVQDTQQIIVDANNLYTKLDAAETKAIDAQTGAISIKNLLVQLINEYKSVDSVKYRKLVNIKDSLWDNDADGINLNGGNTETAARNIQNILKQKVNIGKIIADAQVLLEDNQKLVLTRMQEFNDAAEEFNSYIPESEVNLDDIYDLKEQELEDMINEVDSNINDINNTSDAINNTTQETSDLINEVTGQITPSDQIDENTLYWFAGQTRPTVNFFNSADFEITENKANTWHVFKTYPDGDIELFIAGIDSVSSNSLWYVIVPDKGLTPVKADKTTVDNRFSFIMDVVVDTKTYKLYEVNNVLTTEDDNSGVSLSRLNIIMTTGEAIVDPIAEYKYWYIGTNIPAVPYKPEEGLATEEDGLGWRRIEGELSSHDEFNPISSYAIPVSNSLSQVDFYIVMPNGCAIKDAFADIPLTVFDRIVINGTQYVIVKMRGLEFAYILYYKGSGEEPTGPTGPTGEGPTGEQPTGEQPTGDNYWYIGLNEPTSATIISDDLAKGEYEMGWHYIQGVLTNYSELNPIFAGSADNAIIINENYNDVDYYVVLPAGVGIHGALADPNPGDYTLVNTVELGGVHYNVYHAVGSEFAWILY